VLLCPFIRDNGLGGSAQRLTVASKAGANKRDEMIGAGHFFRVSIQQSAAPNRLPG
jgi:hypothetical protein